MKKVHADKTGAQAGMPKEIEQITQWLQNKARHANERAVSAAGKSSFVAVFKGPQKENKTFAVSLLAKQFNTDVFRVDVSAVISKYIGETEKNLEKIFTSAEQKNWILFFDEADALFSKRTDVKDAHDKYANQEISYLLQKIETYKGLVILATNQHRQTETPVISRIDAIIDFIKDEQTNDDDKDD